MGTGLSAAQDVAHFMKAKVGDKPTVREDILFAAYKNDITHERASLKGRNRMCEDGGIHKGEHKFILPHTGRGAGSRNDCGNRRQRLGIFFIFTKHSGDLLKQIISFSNMPK